MIHNVEDGQTNLKWLENVLHGFHNVSPFFHFGEGKFQTQPNSKKKTVRNYKRRRKRLEKMIIILVWCKMGLPQL